MAVLRRRGAQAPLLLSLAAALALVAATGASVAPFTEDRIKGAFLIQFPSFISWPDETSTGAFTIGVVGERDLVDLFERVAPVNRIRGRPLVFRSLDGAADAARCQVVYISTRQARLLDPMLKALEGLPILTVSDAPDFLPRGGMIHVFLEGAHVRFAINPQAVERARLKISSRLLALARPFKGGSE
jgi:hypothetical protein